DANHIGLTQSPIACGDFALALQHVNCTGSLIINDGRKRQTITQGDRRVALDQFGKQTAARLNTKREWEYVQEHYVFDLAREHAALNRRAHRHYFVRVDLSPRLAPKNLAHLS